MIFIRKARETDLPRIAEVLTPAFQDKVDSIIGDDMKARKLIPAIIKAIHGEIFVAYDSARVGREVGNEKVGGNEEWIGRKEGGRGEAKGVEKEERSGASSVGCEGGVRDEGGGVGIEEVERIRVEVDTGEMMEDLEDKGKGEKAIKDEMMAGIEGGREGEGESNSEEYGKDEGDRKNGLKKEKVEGLVGCVEEAGREGDKEMIVGAIIISTTKFKVTFCIVRACLGILGLIGSMNAIARVRNYLKSLPEKEHREGTLEAVGVMESHRNQGIGEQLIQQGEDFLIAQRMQYFGLGVKKGNPAVELYKRLGFNELTSYENRLGNWIYMRKDLGGNPIDEAYT